MLYNKKEDHHLVDDLLSDGGHGPRAEPVGVHKDVRHTGPARIQVLDNRHALSIYILVRVYLLRIRIRPNDINKTGSGSATRYYIMCTQYSLSLCHLTSMIFFTLPRFNPFGQLWNFSHFSHRQRTKNFYIYFYLLR